MRWKNIGAILTLITPLLLSFSVLQPVAAISTGHGANKDLKLFYYADESLLYTALKAGDIDLSLWELTQAQYRDAITDPNIYLAPVKRLDFRAWSLNNNETIPTYGVGVRIPTSYVGFRKALWRLTDINYYTEVICGGFAVPNYVLTGATQGAWTNTTVVQWVKDNLYFSMTGAAALLDGDGFTQHPTIANPDYKPTVPGSAQNMRVYPPGHSKAGQVLDDVIFVARVDDGLRYGASMHLIDRMRESGIPVKVFSLTSGQASPKVMTARDYMIYSAGWSLGRFGTAQWGWLNTIRWVPGGSNYHVSTTSPGYDRTPGGYNNLDEMTDKINYPTDLEAAQKAAKDAQRLSAQVYASFIPLWSSQAFFGWRNLLGITSMESVGPENDYTYMKAETIDGTPFIKVGHKSPPTMVNQIYSQWVWDVSTMGIVQDGFISLEAYNVMNSQPWILQDWTAAPESGVPVPGVWVDKDDGKAKSVMRYWFRDDPNDDHDPSDGTVDIDAEWINPNTGAVLDDFTPQWLGGGYEFNCWYFDSEPAGWLYGGYRDIKHIIPNPAGKYVDVYFDVSSYWSMYWPYGRNIYAPNGEGPFVHAGWKHQGGGTTQPLSTIETRSFAGPIYNGTFLNTLTPLEGAAKKIPTRAKGTPVEILEVKLDGVTWTEATTPWNFSKTTGLWAGGDYSIVGGTLLAQGPRIRIYANVPAGKTLTVRYWARGDPAGYWPGSTGYAQTLIGTGHHYTTDFLAGAGGWMTYKVNPNHFMEIPPKGEIDFLWYWIPGTQPRDGYYLVSVFDLSPAQYGYGGQGKYIPSTNWVEATDLALPAGETDIADVALIAADLDITFGSPLPNPPPPPPPP